MRYNKIYEPCFPYVIDNISTATKKKKKMKRKMRKAASPTKKNKKNLKHNKYGYKYIFLLLLCV